MKILFISGSLPPIKDGVGDYSAKLLIHLKKSFTLDILSAVDSSEFSSNSFIIHKWNLLNLYHLVSTVDFKKYDLLHIQYPCRVYNRYLLINLVPFVAKLFNRRLKIITTIHNNYRNYTILGRLRLLFLLLFSDHIITVSKKINDYFSEIPIIRKIPSTVIRIGSNFNFSFQAKTNIPDKTSTINIGFFGFLNQTKEIEKLIAGLFHLAESGYHFNWHMICEIDNNNSYHRQILNLIEEKDLISHTIFYEFLPEEKLSEIFEHIDVMILYYKDGVDLNKGSFIAAAQCGIPTITVKSGTENSAVLSNGKNCIISDNMEPESLKASYDYLFTDNNYINISKGAIELSWQFSWHDIAEQHGHLYHSILGS